MIISNFRFVNSNMIHGEVERDDIYNIFFDYMLENRRWYFIWIALEI